MGIPLSVLIIEDSEDDTMLLLRELKRGGYEPIYERVENAAEMSAALERQTWDLITSDHSLPHFSTPEALALLKEKGVDIPFIIVSGSIGEEMAVAAMKAGAHDYLMKSNLTRLVPSVEQGLREAEVRGRLKKTEKKLEESQQSLEEVVETAPSLIVLTDPDGRILMFNSACEELTGYKRDEVLGKTIPELFLPPEWAPVVKKRFADPYAPEVRAPHENPWITKSREERLIEWRCTVLPSPNDGRPCILGTGVDITERKQAEKVLRESEERFKDLFDDAPVGYYEIDMEGRINRVNRTELEMLGYKLEEMLGHYVWEFFVEKEISKQMVIARLAGTIPPGKAYERTCLKKDGTTLPVLVHNRILRDESGRIIGIRSIHQDITERKRGEEEIKKLNQFLEVIIDNADVWLDVLDEKANVLIWNKAAEAISGYSRGEVVGHSKIWEWLYPDENYREEVINKVALAIQRGGGSEDYETTIQRKDGQTRIISWNSRSLLDERRMPTGYIALGWDITQRKKAQQEIANLQEQLRQSQKMEAVGQLAGGIAHDFNNLLTVIKGYSQLSLIQFKESDPLKVNINEINKATDRAADLIRQLLAFSRRQVMEMRVLDLNALLRNLQKMLHRVIGEDIELVTRLADDLGRVKVDPGQIEQVIMNLTVNARDAMIEGGKLTIETANVELDEEYARRHVAVTPGRYVMLAVSDTGVGITPEVRERIFEPFFTTKKGGEGTGLGLSTVYGIVKQSGGNIWVYSEPEKGTTFKIYLPLVNEPLEEKKERVVKEASPCGNETVLVVEDDEVVRKLAVRILQEQGYRVLEAVEGIDAFPVADEHKGPIHLLVTDVVMPKMSGRELAERLASLRPGIKVLYMSGYTDNTIAHHGILDKGMNFIQKPFTVDGLARKVREVLDKQVQDHYEKIG